MSNRAWVTLATNDSYGLGALVLAHSLRRAGSAYPAVVLITPSVTDAMRDRLRAVFAEVVIVDVLDSKDATHLALLQRPELGITFTKLHCWSLTQYEKCVFLDADTLIVQNCDELFEREELSAAPDVGWPDCFNSGVFVYKPSSETFDSLVKFAQERGSFDGGDQGLLNAYFSDWAHGDINKHLPFLYNVTSAAFYSYIPALKHYGQNLKIIHFIGTAKPWLQQFNWETRTAEAPQHLREFLQLWWDIFVGDVHSVLDVSMVEIEEALPAVPLPETFPHSEPRLDYSHYEPILDPESEFPWHHPDAQIPDTDIKVPEIDITEYHDPWDIYKGNIPPSIDDSFQHHVETQKSDDYEEVRKYAWDYVSPQQNDTRYQQSDNSYAQSVDVQNVWEQTFSQQSQFEHEEPSHVDFRGNVWDYNPQHNYNNYDEQSHNNFFQHTPHYENKQSECTDQSAPVSNYNYQESLYSQEKNDSFQTNSNNNNQAHFNDTLKFHNQSFSHNHNVSNFDFSFEKDSEKTHYPIHTDQTRVEHVYYVHLDHERELNKTENDKTELESKINGDGEADYELFENIRPRHPYDGFYLRHRMTIDSRGRKICTHEVPPTPTPTPPESPVPENIWSTEPSENEDVKQNGIEDQTGVAGNLARVVLGSGAQREVLDDLTRRQGWEAGHIDYLGVDAFDNIWAKISQTLSQPRTSPPKQSTPPPQTVAAPPVSESPVTPAPTKIPEPVPASVVVPSEPPVPEQKSEAAKIETPVAAPKVPESPQPVEVPPVKVPEPNKSSEPVAAETAPTSTLPPVAAPESAKVVAAVPIEEPKLAAPAEAPAAAISAAPVKSPPSKAAESKPAESKPAEPKPAESKPAESKPAEPKPAESKPAESKPAEPKPAESKPAEPKPAESKPVEQKPAESKPAESKPAEAKPAASKPAEVVPATPPKVESAPAQAPPAKVAAPSTPVAPKAELTPEKGASTDSPPLANTPSKEDVPIVPAAKSEERRKPAGKLQLHPPAAADPLPTPDSEPEDAAALAHAIIASEQGAGAVRTPTVTSPSPSADPASPPPPPLAEQRLSVEEPELPTPPVGAVSLSQIGVTPQPKPKATTAAQIESSVTEAAAETPKKKVVKKVLKKEGATSGEAPVPPPRKKEKKPKDK